MCRSANMRMIPRLQYLLFQMEKGCKIVKPVRISKHFVHTRTHFSLCIPLNVGLRLCMCMYDVATCESSWVANYCIINFSFIVAILHNFMYVYCLFSVAVIFIRSSFFLLLFLFTHFVNGASKLFSALAKVFLTACHSNMNTSILYTIANRALTPWQADQQQQQQQKYYTTFCSILTFAHSFHFMLIFSLLNVAR